MNDTRRDFLMRFAATALAASGTACETVPEVQKIDDPRARVVYGPPARAPEGTVEHFNAAVGSEVRFDTGSRALTPEAKAILDRQIAWLRRFPDFAVMVEGHCDERGSREYNLALGESRAASVKNYMVVQGVAAGRIQAVSYGKERPLDPGHGEESWARNRRAVTVPGPTR
ncbi:MAG: peptidoglycan-associated lipoprotein Pal [Magnetospirillum sp. WYHS-4]